MTAGTSVASGVDAHGFWPGLKRPSHINGVIPIGILRQLFGLRDPRRIHPRIAVVTVDTAVVSDFFWGRP